MCLDDLFVRKTNDDDGSRLNTTCITNRSPFHRTREVTLKHFVPHKLHGRFYAIYSIGIRFKKVPSRATSVPNPPPPLQQRLVVRTMINLPLMMTTTMMKTMMMSSTKNIPRSRTIHPTNTTKMQNRKRCQSTKLNRQGAIDRSVRNARPIFRDRAFALGLLTKMQGHTGDGFILTAGACR